MGLKEIIETVQYAESALNKPSMVNKIMQQGKTERDRLVSMLKYNQTLLKEMNKRCDKVMEMRWEK